MYPATATTIIVNANSSVQGYAVPGAQNAYAFPAATAPPAYSVPPNPPVYHQQPPVYPNQPPVAPNAGGKLTLKMSSPVRFWILACTLASHSC